LYITLTRAEAAFRAMKSPLAERPIFHQLERRVETHIFLCVLAYHLLVAIETTLGDHDQHTSWSTVREVLRTHQVVTIVLPTDGGRVLRIRKATTPEPEHMVVYRLLNVPPEIIRPRRPWSTPPLANCSDKKHRQFDSNPGKQRGGCGSRARSATFKLPQYWVNESRAL